MFGIDISHWNGAIDFNKVNADFVIMKLSQAQYKDTMFESYYAKCNKPKGCYIYNKVKNVTDAIAEANFAVQALKGRPMPLGVWLDMEDSSMQRLGKPMLNAIIAAESDILMKAGYSVGIYCNRNWYLNVLDSSYLSKHFPFWIARYPLIDTGKVKESLSPANLANCVMWQYSSKGKVNGINGNVDLNMTFDVKPFIIPPKTIHEIALEVIDGKWGNGIDRKNRLHDAGYDYAAVQTEVNRLLKK